MDNKILRFLAVLCIVPAGLVGAARSVPNPFNRDFRGFFVLKGDQIISISHKPVQNISFESYFSYLYGFSYTFFKDNNDDTQIGHAILTDSWGTDRIYVIRNPRGEANGTSDCELDNVHHHKHIFPWLYAIQYAGPKKGSVYGPLAIWLNAISEPNSMVPDYPDFDVWAIDKGGNTRVQVAFHKRSDRPSWFKVIQEQQAKNSDDPKNGLDHFDQLDHYDIKSFDTIESFRKGDKATRKTVNLMHKHLTTCRNNKIKHRIFPDLANYLTTSPQSMFYIRYLRQISPLYQQQERASNSDGRKSDMVAEMVSLQREAQYVEYRASSEAYVKRDAYLKLFTANFSAFAKPPKEDGINPYHLTTQYYHIFDTRQRSDNTTSYSGCFEGGREPHNKHKIFSRPINFHRYINANNEQVTLTGHLSGLVALLSNAAHRHYKEFVLGTTEMKHTKTGQITLADHWVVHDEHSSWDIHFYFKQDDDRDPEQRPNETPIDRLVTVEIRDATIEAGQSAQPHDYNLLMRFFIIRTIWDYDAATVDKLLKVPDICVPVTNQDDGEEEWDDEDDSEFDSDDEASEDDSEGEDSEDEDEHEHKEIDGEGFELDHGTISEYSRELPNPFRKHALAKDSFEVVSEISLGADLEAALLLTDHKKIYLSELRSLQHNTLRISIYLSEYSLKENKPHTTYYFRYRSDALFVVRPGGAASEYCQYIDDVDEPWLRLLSETTMYNIDLPDRVEGERFARLSILSNRLREYGLGAIWFHAVNSRQAEFRGKSGRTIQLGDGSEYLPVHWWLDEADMSMYINFLYNVTKHKENKAAGKHDVHDEKLLHFDSLYVRGSHRIKTNFRPIDVRVIKYSTIPGSTLHNIPESCQSAVAMADRAVQSRYEHVMGVPRFDRFVGPEQAYRADYILQQGESLSGRIREVFDREGRGWIESGQGGTRTEQLFIERQKLAVLHYDEDSKECRLLNFAEVEAGLMRGLTCDSDKFNPNRRFGLADLWSALTELPMHLSVNPIGQNLYVRYGAVTNRNDMEMEHEMAFVARKGSRELSQLEPVQFFSSPTETNADSQTEVTSIIINKFDRDVEPSDVPPLPESCAKLIADTATSAPPVDPEKAKAAKELFPRLTPRLDDKFMMRSAVAISDSQGGAMTYLLDEQYARAGGVRLKSFNGNFKGSDMDLLIYPATDEYFELSSPSECQSNRVPLLTGGAKQFIDKSESKLARFWSDDKTSVDSPSDLYYGAMGLWRLAERNLDHIELMDSPVNGTAPDDIRASINAVRRWKVSIPGRSWSYELFTTEYSNKHMTWSVLEEIVVTEESRKVGIEVVNYRYGDRLADMGEQFSLPVGHGCERSDVAVDRMSEAEDVFELDPARGFVLWYEASLEVVDYDEESGGASRRRILPTYSGELMHVGRIGRREFDLTGQVSFSEYAHDGTPQAAKKTVSDRSSGLTYDIDLTTGSCLRKEADFISHSQDLTFVLEFPAEGGRGPYSINVPIDMRYRTKFWYDEAKNRITDRFVDSTYDYSVYEQSHRYLELSKDLTGRASVIRFFYADSDTSTVRSEEGRLVRNHDEMHTRVMLFDDQTGNKLKAVLNLSLYRLPRYRLRFRSTTSHLLELLSVTECFFDLHSAASNLQHRIMGSYKISYPQVDAAGLVDSFYNNLITSFDIDLDQLDGKAQVTDVDDAVEIHFNVWNPSTLNAFAVMKEATMGESMERVAMSRPDTDFADCFRICQSEGCIAMSYCEKDRVCRFVRRRGLRADAGKLQHQISSGGQSKKGCLYYYRRNLDRAPLTISRFSDMLNLYVNSERAPSQLDQLSLRIGEDSLIRPIRFERLIEDIDRMEDLTKEYNMFGEEEVNYKLDLLKLDQLNKEMGLHFEASTSSQLDITDCLLDCFVNDCLYLSHCKKGRTCTRITNGDDVHLLRTGVRVEAGVDEGCVVMVKDLHNRYDVYDNTTAPAVWTRRLDDYTEAECAFACEAGRDRCLSFDYCQFVGEASSNSTCLLQSDHLAMDNIQRATLGPSLLDDLNQIDDRDVYCQHYSRAPLFDFERLPNRQFEADWRNYQTVRGKSARKCAAMCIQDDCDVFEYCRDMARLHSGISAESCRFPRSANYDIVETNPSIRQLCFIYNRTQVSRDQSIQEILHSDSLIEEQAGAMQAGATRYWIYAAYLLIAAVVGTIVQITFKKVRGTPLLFD